MGPLAAVYLLKSCPGKLGGVQSTAIGPAAALGCVDAAGRASLAVGIGVVIAALAANVFVCRPNVGI